MDHLSLVSQVYEGSFDCAQWQVTTEVKSLLSFGNRPSNALSLRTAQTPGLDSHEQLAIVFRSFTFLKFYWIGIIGRKA